MRKMIFFMLTTLDGFYEGPNKEIDWHRVIESPGVTHIKFRVVK